MKRSIGNIEDIQCISHLLPTRGRRGVLMSDVTREWQ